VKICILPDRHFDIDGEKRGFRPQETLAQLKNSLPRLFPGATERQNNIIVRPHSDTAQLIQLDHLKTDALSRLHDVAFLTLQTSPGNLSPIPAQMCAQTSFVH
jgi:hypothetical protein